MKIQTKNNIGIMASRIGLTTLVILSLFIFCYFANLSLIIPLLLVLLGIHLLYFEKASRKLFLELGLLLALLMSATNGIIEYTDISILYVPVASVAMLTILLYNDLQLAFIMSFISSVIVGLMIGNNYHLMLTFFVGSLTAVYSVKDARARGRLINTGLFVGVIQIICIMLLKAKMQVFLSQEFLLNYVRPLLFSGVISAFVVIATSKIFETLFGVLTNFSLLELSDVNSQPLLKKLLLEAPGTYHHSLIVSNLAETAANAIGANGLLARVGAYYHDVGKMNKPEYFNENQIAIGNKHDGLEPTMSRLVILNHVKEGIELAKRHKLNPQIIDFIPQHHGTGLIHYFYQRALEDAQDETIEEGTFRYPGPKPQSRETAVVLLADSVEGAVRSLGDPTPNKIDEVVRKVINNKFIDGQLDECTLTLRDIDLISSTFVRILSAMYHSRVKYPEKKDENGHNHQKSTEAKTSQSHPDSQNCKENSSS